MSIIDTTTLQSDENGLLTLQCDRCKSRFKIDCAYLIDELEDEICCPICGISESLNTFWPEEVVKEAEKIALAEAEQMIADAFKGLKSKYKKVKTPPVHKVDTDKTDKRDAALIARCLAHRDYSLVHMPTEQDEQVKEYIRMRQ